MTKNETVSKLEKLSEFDKLPKQVIDLIQNGIPVKAAVFQTVVQSFTGDRVGEPTHVLYADEAKPSRLAKMWWTPNCLVYVQPFGCGLVPRANVVYARVS